MIPKKKNKEEAENYPQSNSKPSGLNVNATEFVPSTPAQRLEPTILCYCNNSFTSPSTESNEHKRVDMQAFNYGPIPCYGLFGPEWFDANGRLLSRPNNMHSSPLAPQMQSFGIPWGPFDYGASAHAMYSHPVYPAEMARFDFSEPSIAENEPFTRQEYDYTGYSLMDDEDYQSFSYVTTENSSSLYNWHQEEPCVEEHCIMNPKFIVSYKMGRDSSHLTGGDWNIQHEYKDTATNPIASCLPDTELSLSDNTHQSSENLTELSGVASFSPEMKPDGTKNSLVTCSHLLEPEAEFRLKLNTNESPENPIELPGSFENETNVNVTNRTVGCLVSSVDKTKKLNNNKNENNLVINVPVASSGDKPIDKDAQLQLVQSKKKKKLRREEVCSQKVHLCIVFIGHVDAGKSTLGGQLMLMAGDIDERIIKKYQKEAIEKSRDSWFLSWTLDTNQEERDRGKTVETGRGYFETLTKHFTILDAPGHKSFVPNMICGTAQADIAVLVLSARQNEFESGFDKGGQTRDHTMLAKSAGFNILIVAVNKMDDPTVKWDENRFNYCRIKTLPYLKKLGYIPKEVPFIPVSAQTGDNVMTPVLKSTCPWYKGPCLIECLEKLPPIARNVGNPFVMPIAGRFKDKGTVVMGKIEAGTTYISNSLLLMPNKVPVTVEQIWSDDRAVTLVKAGENVKIRLKGVEEEEISPGFVLCDIKNPITTAILFDAQLHILDCKHIITAGFSAVMHFQSIAEDVTVTHLFRLVDPKTNLKTRRHNLRFVKMNDDAIMRIQCSGVVCLTTFKEFHQLGRFTLRDDNKVIAIGKVLKIIK